MASRIAVAILHGAGIHEKTRCEDGMAQMEKALQVEIARLVPGVESASVLAFKLAYWDTESRLQQRQNTLKKIMCKAQVRFGGRLTNLISPGGARGYLFDRIGDVVGYQSRPVDCDPKSDAPDRRDTYYHVHKVVADCLYALAQAAGADAPLFIIAHSLGTIISSNYIYDLQKDYPLQESDQSSEIEESSQKQPYTARLFSDAMGQTPLERGETLTCFFTMGSPLALWSLQYEKFNQPIHVPSEHLPNHYKGLSGEWVNFYDKDDIIAYPLQPLYEHHLKGSPDQRVVTDQQVNVGPFWRNWTALSHSDYWTDDDVVKPIAKALANTWEAINPQNRESREE